MKKFTIILGVIVICAAGIFMYKSSSKGQKDFSSYAYFTCQNGIHYKYYKKATDTGVTYYYEKGKVLAECAAWFGGQNCAEIKELAGSCEEEVQ